MSTRNINKQKNKLLISEITTSDTISQFMEKCNNNFSAIVEYGGGPAGIKGDMGDPGAPTKPKVPIHVWIEDNEYYSEYSTQDGGFAMNYKEDLSNVKYQEGHLIILQNAHVYRLELVNFNLIPKYILGLQTFNPGDIVDGKNAYLHIAYADSPNGTDGFITDQELRNENVSTYTLNRSASKSNSVIEKKYMGIYSDNNVSSSNISSKYTWVQIQGEQGIQGIQGIQGKQGNKGDKGDKGDGYIGHPYTIDVEGDLSTISISSVNGTRLYTDDYCECIIHSYYGDENVKLNENDVTINLPEDYIFNGTTTIVLNSNKNKIVGKIEKTQRGNDVIIRFTPDESFVFPEKQLIFPISVESTIFDKDAKQDYKFDRKTIWTIKGITSTFELEIIPSHRTIKIFENGTYYPNILSVDVYKIEDKERTQFDLKQNTNFKLLYKNYDNNEWSEYKSAIETQDVSCLEFKIVTYNDSTNTDKEEIWDYEDVWAVADGKNSHYYHADLGNTESMMVLTTGQQITKETNNGSVECAELKNNSGYSITFDPKFYDGTEPLTVSSINIYNGDDNEYYIDGSFVRGLNGYTFTVTSVPYGVDMIPMSFMVKSTDGKEDIVSFNIYISTLSDIYTLVPTVSSYNTSTGKTNDKIGCSVYKNNSIVNISNLSDLNLTLSYQIYNENGSNKNGNYIDSEKLNYGGNGKNGFTASDVAIEFILKHYDTVVVRSTVPLIKDGVNGKDGDNWQYIFCICPKYPFSENTNISDPSKWVDNKPTDSNNELLGNNGVKDTNWSDDHKGVNNQNKYEYQSYRKWNKDEKCWGQYTTPTLYSNYSEDGNGYSIILSNPVATIPVGEDWKSSEDWMVDEGLENQTDETLVYFYNNTTDLSKNQNVSISIPDDYSTYFSVSRNNEQVNKVIFTPIKDNKIFDFGSNKPYTVPITVTYNTFKTTINWTLTPLKGLEDVEVFVDKMVVNTTTQKTHNLNVGYNIISSNGNKTLVRDKSNSTNIKKYNICLCNSIDNWNNNTHTYLNNWSGASYNFENGDCYVVLTDSNNNIIDYSIVTTVNDGKKGDPGISGNTPTLNSIEIVGYSLKSNEDINTESNWKKNISDLTASPGQIIYILNKYNWSTGTKKVVTSTLAGTQGIEGKSRVLFYLGSFETGKATLNKDTQVVGKLTDERCDYYIDKNGQAWMRTGTEENATANPDGYTSNNDKWKKSETVGFLKAGAIHAEMINTGSLAVNEGFISALTAEDAFINNLTVDASKITGTLDANKINVTSLNTKPDSDRDKIEIKDNSLKIFTSFYDDDEITGEQNVEYIDTSTLITSDNITSTTIDNITSEYYNRQLSYNNGPNADCKITLKQVSEGMHQYYNESEYVFVEGDLNFLNENASLKLYTTFQLSYPVYDSNGKPYPNPDALRDVYFRENDGGLKVIIECIDKQTDKWKECDESFYINDTDCNKNDWGRFTFERNITIKKRGVYRYKIVMYKFYTAEYKNELYLNHTTELKIKRNLKKSQFTEIGKNGLLIKMDGDINNIGRGGFNTFYVSRNEIAMYIQNEDNAVDICGLKLDSKNGLQVKYNTSWITLKDYVKTYCK